MGERQFSVYDAKARFSELLRMVEQSDRITITRHGVPVALLIPPPKPPESFAERLTQLMEAGEVDWASTAVTARDLKPMGSRPGALKRFLRDRE